MELGPKRREMRGAVWLWLQMLVFAEESSEEWWLVCDGGEISHERVAVFLDVSAARVRKWHLRLEKLGVIRAELIRSGNWRFWVRNPNQGDQPKPLEKSALTISKFVH